MALISSIAGPLISAAGGLVGNLLGFGSQAATNNANMKLAEYQYEKNLEMWNKNNEYNTPLAQRQRMEAAGFNPNLVYGHGSVSNTSTSVPQYSAPTLGAYTNFSNIGELAFNSYLALKNSAADIDLKESAADKNRADAQNLRDENGGISFKNKILEYQSLIQKNLSDLENERSEWYHLRAGDEYEKLHQEITNMLKSFDKMVSDINVNEARVDNLNADTNYIKGPKTLNTNADTGLKGAQISESRSRIVLNDALVKKAQEDVGYLHALTDQVMQNISQSSEMFPLLKESKQKAIELTVKDIILRGLQGNSEEFRRELLRKGLSWSESEHISDMIYKGFKSLPFH